MSKKIDIVALARENGIDEEIIQALTKRELCALINSTFDKQQIDCDKNIDEEPVSDQGVLEKVQWTIRKVVKKKAKTSVVEWFPTCASRQEFKIYQENFDVKSVEQNQIHVQWKNSWITKRDPLRVQKEVLERQGTRSFVSWHPSCLTREVYEREKEHVEKVLDYDAVLIHWPHSEVDSASIKEPDDEEPPKEKRRRVCAPDKDVERNYLPELELLVAQPGFPSDELLMQAGQQMQRDERKKEAKDVFSKYWRDRVGDEFSKLYYIDNRGNGDCMYYALAPMIRALKPNLFEPVADVDKDMIRLRQLLASRIGKTAKSINTYLSVYESNFGNAAQKKAFRAANPQLKTEPPLIDNVAERRLKLQNDLVQADHWAHLNDFDLLHDLLGPSVHLVIFNANFQNGVPPFHLVENAVTPNSKFVFIVHSSDHFVRLQQKDGKFAFSEQEFDQQFPLISSLYKNTLFPSNINIELVRLQNDVFQQYPTLRAAIPEKGEFDTFYYQFLGIAKNREAEMVEKIVPQIARYSSLNAADRLALRNTLLGNRPGASQEELAALAQTKVNQFVTVIDNDNDDVPFCAPLTAAEEERFNQVMSAAEKSLDGEILNVHGTAVPGRWILLLKPLRWINGDLVQLYMELLVKDHNAMFQDKVETASTYLYDKISNKNQEIRDMVKRWKNPLKDGTLSKLFIPINNGNHWFLCVVDFNKKEIQFYDSLCSLGDNKQEYADNIKTYLRMLTVDVSTWKVKQVDKKATPQQENGSDCGVFLMAYALQLQSPSFDGFTFTQTDIPCFRKRILLRLIAANEKK